MKALVINLDRQSDRLEYFSKQARVLGLNFERISACDERSLSESFKESFRTARPFSHWSSGAIGCFLSHRKALSVIADARDDYGVIFEDDVYLSPRLSLLLSNLESIPADADIIRIETSLSGVRLGKRQSIGGAFCVAPLKSEAWGAGGYIISRSAAQFVLAAPDRLHCVADAFLFQPSLGRLATLLKRYQLLPAACIQDKARAKPERVGLGSAIQHLPENFDPGGWYRATRHIAHFLSGKTSIRLA